MKLRMYLRGLGLGIIITAIILTFAVKPKDGKMSDADVKKRAQELGMVEESATLVQAAPVPEISENSDVVISEPAKEEVSEKTSEPAKEEVNEKASEPSEEVEEEAGEKVEDVASETEKKEEEALENQAEEKAEEDTETLTEEKEKPKNNSTTTITVAGGSSSDKVAKLLEKGGIVDSASKFDAYLCSNGYDKRIAAGNHVIPANADYHTIAEILVTR